jgi:adenylosuccinate synthase
MTCIIVVGGQYGSEGKGKVVSILAETMTSPMIVRCGGPNSGHSLTFQGKEVVLRQVPAGIRNPDALLLISAGCVIDEDILIKEIEFLGLDSSRIIVDPRAVLIEAGDHLVEETLRGKIGSTGSGTGSASIRRMLRDGQAKLVSNSARLRKRVTVSNVATLIHSHLDKGGDVIVEGTQGFGLSLLHSPHYPYVTSKDTSASGFASEVGLSPRQVDAVVMVIRTFPIRVGGNSGPLKDEISWEQLQKISGAPLEQPEYTSVTHRLRRVGMFDIETIKTACLYNRPTSLAIMGLDRLDYQNCGVQDYAELSDTAHSFIRFVESETGIPVGLVGTGFRTEDSICLKVREDLVYV